MLKIFRQWGYNLQVFAGGRVDKSDGHGVKRLSLQGKGIFPSLRVYFISQQRMTDAGHMHPDLMGTPRLQLALYISVFTKTAKYPKMCHGMPAAFLIDSHLFAIGGMSAYGFVHGSLLFLYYAVADGPVTPGDGMLLQLCGNAVVSLSLIHI